jgi:hypothetical protein
MAERFPQFKARDLEGKEWEVPLELSGRANLVVLAFEREQQHPIETWVPDLERLEGRFPGLEVWVLAALARSYRWWRAAIDSGMRAGIKDPVRRRHTLTAYLDTRWLQTELALTNDGRIQLYLLERSGLVRHREAGAIDPQKLDRLTTAIGQLLADGQGETKSAAT